MTGGGNNIPEDWATEITKAIPGFSTDGFILAGDWSRFWDKDRQEWRGDCPHEVQNLIKGFSKQACLGGGFIWDMDAILKWGTNWPNNSCAAPVYMPDYVKAIQDGMKGIPPQS